MVEVGDQEHGDDRERHDLADGEHELPALPMALDRHAMPICEISQHIIFSDAAKTSHSQRGMTGHRSRWPSVAHDGGVLGPTRGHVHRSPPIGRCREL
jgi:hypothetical protein